MSEIVAGDKPPNQYNRVAQSRTSNNTPAGDPPPPPKKVSYPNILHFLCHTTIGRGQDQQLQ